MKKIELLAPARDIRSGITAIDYGADAVYIGGARFGARYAASNSAEDIACLVEYARGFGARVYAALNTIVYEHELKEAEAVARDLIAAGVDALIIQDMAFVRMGLGDVEFHASTQTCNVDAGRIKFLQESGFSRVILERGLTLQQIKEIRAATEIELECFVHGAICVGFSGQCYFSRSMGSRSGNRGECAQPCRLPYDLLDENGNTIRKNEHILSVQDMDLTRRIPQLIDAGVTSFKIEGRLKEVNYVKNIVANYRREIDRVIATRKGFVRASCGRTIFDFEPDPKRTFNRGATLWMIDGQVKGVSSFNTPKAIGAYVGEVSRIGDCYFEFKDVHTALYSGDGICYMAGGELRGTGVNKIEGRRIFANKQTGITPGIKIYRNYDRAFSLQLDKSITRRIIYVAADINLNTNRAILKLSDTDGIIVELSYNGDLEAADNPDKMFETIRSQISKTGGTIFNVNNINIEVGNGKVPFIPVSVLNDLRRRAFDALLAQRKKTMLRQVRSIVKENNNYPYPSKRVGGEANVTNSLSEMFYGDHGVGEIDPGFDLNNDLKGRRVMTSAYCIRRELDMCLKEKPRYRGILYLQREDRRYKLDFDCLKCQMNIIME